jgi:hypothetical protein
LNRIAYALRAARSAHRLAQWLVRARRARRSAVTAAVSVGWSAVPHAVPGPAAFRADTCSTGVPIAARPTATAEVEELRELLRRQPTPGRRAAETPDDFIYSMF